MRTCTKCGEEFRYRNATEKFQEHFLNFHAKPRKVRGGKIRLNAIHQIIILVKGDLTWREMIRIQGSLDRKYKRIDKMSWEAMEQLMRFELKHGIEFFADEDDVTYRERF